MDLLDSDNFPSGVETTVSSCTLRKQSSNSSSSLSSSGSQTSIINSATFARQSGDESDLDSYFEKMSGGDVDNSSTKISRITRKAPTAEELQAKKEKHEKWLAEKLERQRRQRRLEQKKLEREQEKKVQAEEERRQKAADELKKWMERKKIDADCKLARMKQAEMDFQQRQQAKKRELSKKISYDEWLQSKSAEVKRKSVTETRRPKNDVVGTRQVKQKLSYEDWLAASKSKSKPVPLNRGLDSLRGSMSNIRVNPVPWKI